MNMQSKSNAVGAVSKSVSHALGFARWQSMPPSVGRGVQNISLQHVCHDAAARHKADTADIGALRNLRIVILLKACRSFQLAALVARPRTEPHLLPAEHLVARVHKLRHAPHERNDTGIVEGQSDTDGRAGEADGFRAQREFVEDVHP